MSMLLIQISRDDYDRLNELALLPMAEASFHEDAGHAAVTLACETRTYFEEVVAVLADQHVAYKAIGET